MSSLLRAFAIKAALLLCLSISTYAQTKQPLVSVHPISGSSAGAVLILDGKVIEAESLQVVRGRQVMIWIRDMEKLGWGTAESSASGETLFQAKGVTLSFTKNAGVAKINSLSVQLSVDTYLRDGKLMVPLSFVTKALGYEYDCSYKTVATILTTFNPTPIMGTGLNSIEGKVLYNSKGIKGIKVRAADKDLNAVKGALVRTDSEGNYTISGLPDGEYAAYAYTGDNPSYFNRASEAVVVKGGVVARIRPIALGKIISPIKPKIGESISATNGKIGIAWETCEGATSYEITIEELGSNLAVLETAVAKPPLQVQADKLKRGVVYEIHITALDTNGDFVGGTAGAGATPWTFSIKR